MLPVLGLIGQNLCLAAWPPVMSVGPALHEAVSDVCRGAILVLEADDFMPHLRPWFEAGTSADQQRGCWPAMFGIQQGYVAKRK